MSAGLNHSLPRGGVHLFLRSLFAAALLPACGGSGTTEPPEMWPKGNIVLVDTNNFTSTTSLDIPIVPTAPGADLMICWNALMNDLLCHPINATNSIDNVGFLQIPNMTKDVAEMNLAVGRLDPNLVTTYGEFHTNQSTNSCAMLSQFTLGSAINPATDYVLDTTKTYMLLFAHGTTPGVGSRSMLFLEPTAGSTVTSVNALDACANNVLMFSATLGLPMSIPAMDSTMWHVDWSQITHDSFGTPVKVSGSPVTFKNIDSVLLGFYQDKTPDDLRAQFKDIEIIATTLYEVPVALGARDVNLANAKVRGGSEPFMGFNRTNGTWALAVMCSKCQIPAPVLMTILEPQSP